MPGHSSAGRTLLHWLWPQICAHCREDLPKDCAGPLCPSCRRALIPNEPPFCERCSEPLRPPHSHCLACSSRLHACRLIRSAFLYRGPAVSLVHAFKFRGRRSAARAAGTWMAEALPRLPELGRPDYLVPMPLHPKRRRERGYNQAALIAEALSSSCNVPLAHFLVRARATRPQWSLSREDRRRNLQGAFAYSGPAGAARGKSFWVIDDVCTSAASLEACALTLQEAGAAQVLGFVFARQANAIS